MNQRMLCGSPWCLANQMNGRSGKWSGSMRLCGFWRFWGKTTPATQQKQNKTNINGFSNPSASLSFPFRALSWRLVDTPSHLQPCHLLQQHGAPVLRVISKGKSIQAPLILAFILILLILILVTSASPQRAIQPGFPPAAIFSERLICSDDLFF